MSCQAPRACSLPRPHHERGFTLFEVLVSILVLAIGMLAAAGLQLSAIRTTQQSSTQTLAMGLAADMADRMRSNDLMMDKPDSANPFLGIDFQADQALSEPAVYCNRESAACTAAELAAFDIYEWEKRLRDALPTARAVICRDTNAWDAVGLSYKWACAVNSAVGNGGPVTIKIGWQGKNPAGKLERLANGDFPPQVALIVAPYSQ